MCEVEPGEIIVSFPDHPVATRVMTSITSLPSRPAQLLETLDEVLAGLDIPMPTRVRSRYHYWRMGVAVGQERFAADQLRQQYQRAVLHDTQEDRAPSDHDHSDGGWSDADVLVGFAAQPHHLLALASPATTPTLNVAVHHRYAAMVGLTPRRPAGRARIVAVLDSGAVPTVLGPHDRWADFVADARFDDENTKRRLDPVLRSDARSTDPTGHGSTVVSIIRNLAPDVVLNVYRVASQDRRGRSRIAEFDVLAALLSCADADVINMSFGLTHSSYDFACDECGRHAGASRSLVLERVIEDVRCSPRCPMIVAAAGNNRAPTLTYPARYSAVVAVGSVDSTRRMSPFSNHGAIDENGGSHPNLFFAPGGGQPDEIVATSGSRPAGFWGTSFSAAYATSVIVHALAGGQSPAFVLAGLRQKAGRLDGHDKDLHGSGLITL